MTKIIIALDCSDQKFFEEKVTELAPFGVIFKIGLEVINSIGAEKAVEIIKKSGSEVFFDGKFNDIPNTMGKTVKNTAKLGVKSISIHASSGEESIKAAIANKGNSEIWLVTTLTSMADDESVLVFGKNAQDKVLAFAEIGIRIGVDGVICSSKEAKMLKQIHPEIKLITPGIRPIWYSNNDQKRSMTPKEASELGIEYLVIGRPVTEPIKGFTSKEALEKILNEAKL